jgi:gluconate kinase
MNHFNPHDFHNWLPSKLFEQDGALFLEWIYLCDVRFNMPFFDESLAKCRTSNTMEGVDRRKDQISSIDFLSEVAQTVDAVEPSLFIFHTSRCGSTLATQVLSLQHQNIVFPEYRIADAILRATISGEPVSEEKRKEWLKNLIRIMGQKRFSTEERLIIKLDSWHFCYYNLLRELFPEVPFAILYREPEAILRSNSKQWGMQFIPEIVPPSIFHIEFDASPPFSFNGYANQVLQSMYASIQTIARADNCCLLLDYCNGVAENLSRLTEILQIDHSFLQREDVKERMKFHSKRPEAIFHEELEQHEPLASERTIQAYNQLKKLFSA